ncbi:hypothetical protein F5Y18DRAFT_425495 [Xylariaceae sp. FL1019]|nr:hypothetical protein F5Y18DRAFT_425495 [Xylariaceae sp. FL1019]
MDERLAGQSRDGAVATSRSPREDSAIALAPSLSDQTSLLSMQFREHMALSPKQGNSTTWGPLLPEIWLIVANQSDSVGDVFRLGRLNKSFSSLTLFDRAAINEACRYMCKTSMLTMAIQKNMDIEYIKTVLRGCRKSQTAAAQGFALKYFGRWIRSETAMEPEPALHAAARYGRIDVVEEMMRGTFIAEARLSSLSERALCLRLCRADRNVEVSAFEGGRDP